MSEQTDINTIEAVIGSYFEDSFNDNKSGEYTEEIQAIESAWGRVSEAAKSYLYGQEIRTIGQYIDTWLATEITDPDIRLLEADTEHMLKALGIEPNSEKESALTNWLEMATAFATDAYIGGAR
tara:strand:+ start:7804 stop:8175 length:372 start_codon:yes stop_codon:yes gene_type:complete